MRRVDTRHAALQTPCCILLCGLLGASAAFEMNILRAAALPVLAFLILTGDETDDLLVYTVLIPYAGLCEIAGYNLLFVLLLFSSGKLLLAGRPKRLHTAGWAGLILFIGMTAVQDLLYASIGRLLYLESILCYFSLAALFLPVPNIQVCRLRFALLGSLLSAVLFTLLGSLGSGVFSARFGEQLRELGGAMGLPIYCLLILALLAQSYLCGLRTVRGRLGCLLLMAFAGLAGVLTQSRVYLLGLLILLTAVLFCAGKGRSLRILQLILCAAGAVLLFWLLFPALFGQLADAIYLRLRENAGSGRLGIYRDCLQYLWEHPLRLLFGSGAFHYVDIGVREGYRFSAMAHSLYLDLLMSWGLAGYTYIGVLLFTFRNRLRAVCGRRVTMLCMLPVLPLAGCFLTEGTFQYYNVYLYLLVLLVNLYGWPAGMPYKHAVRTEQTADGVERCGQPMRSRVHKG